MTKAVAMFKGPDAKALQAIANSFVAAAESPQTYSDGRPILRMSRDGVFMFGVDNTEVEEGAQLCVNIQSWQKGFRAWSEFGVGQPTILGEILVKFNEPLPGKGALEDVGQPWQPCFSVDMTIISGEDAGIEVNYSPTSGGGIDFGNKLAVAIGKRAAEGKTDLNPVITLATSGYTSKRYGPQVKPEFVVVGWNKIGTVEVKKTKPKASKARTRTKK